jgi:hypothetical protein
MEKINMDEPRKETQILQDIIGHPNELEEIKKKLNSEITVCSVKVKKEDTQKLLKVLKE